MQEPHLIGEALFEALRHLRSQRDLRHEGDSPLALRQTVSDGLQVHLRLAAAGRSVKQPDARRCCGVVHRALELGKRALLVRSRQEGCVGCGHVWFEGRGLQRCQSFRDDFPYDGATVPLAGICCCHATVGACEFTQ